MKMYSTKIFLNTQKTMIEWYDFSNVKSSKMSSFDSVAEAHSMVYPRLSRETFSFVLPDSHRW